MACHECWGLKDDAISGRCLLPGSVDGVGQIFFRGCGGGGVVFIGSSLKVRWSCRCRGRMPTERCTSAGHGASQKVSLVALGPHGSILVLLMKVLNAPVHKVGPEIDPNNIVLSPPYQKLIT